MKKIIRLTEVDLLRHSGKSFEDARLISIQDDVVTLIGAIWQFGGKKSNMLPAVAHQAILQANFKGDVLSVRIPSFGYNTNPIRHEKNWMPILGTSKMVYTINPDHIIYDLESGASFHSPEINWSFGIPHGGSQVIDLSGRYLAIFHSSLDTYLRKPASVSMRIVRHYFLGAYQFSKSPPYKIISKTNYPILSASLNNPSVFNSPISLIAHGLAEMGDTLLISVGVNDAASALIQIPTKNILSRLVKI
jgi:hypothetical protein